MLRRLQVVDCCEINANISIRMLNSRVVLSGHLDLSGKCMRSHNTEYKCKTGGELKSRVVRKVD